MQQHRLRPRRRPAPRRPAIRLRGAGRLAVAASLAAAGMLFATSATTADGGDLRGAAADLPSLIEGESGRADQRVARVERLRAEVETLTGSVAVGDARVAEIGASDDALETLAGLSPMTGPGLVVELDDAPADLPQPDSVRPDDLVVHQQDVQSVVNALWRGGAEAMVLQDQRVITTTAFRCAGNTMTLHARVYSPPYRVTVVGDPDELRRALAQDAGVALYREFVDALGLGYSVSTREEVVAPAYEGSLELRAARAVVEDQA